MTETLMAYAAGSTQGTHGARSEDISEGRMIVTPNMAARILLKMDYDKQRPSKEHHINLLAQQMRAGVWMPGSQIAFGRFGGRLHLVNGRHRMCALREVGRAQEFQVLIVDCATVEELHALFYRFDTNGRARSEAEILNSMGVADANGVSKSMAAAVYQAGCLIQNGFVPMSGQYSFIDPILRTPDGKLNAAKKWWPFAKELDSIFLESDSNIKRGLRLPGVVAVALVTIEASPAKAHEFWSGVATDAPKGDPRRTLRDLILAKQMAHHPSGVMYPSASTATAWNAFSRNDRLRSIRVYAGTKVKIAGTKYVVGEVK